MTTGDSSRSEPLVQRCHGKGWPDQMKSAHECVLGSLNYLQSIPFQFNHEQVAAAASGVGLWAMPLGHCHAVSGWRNQTTQVHG